MNKYKIFLTNLCLDNVKRIATKDHNECMHKFHWKSSAKKVINYNEEVPDSEIYIFLFTCEIFSRSCIVD